MKLPFWAAAAVSAWVGSYAFAAVPGDWPEPRHDPDLTAVQPVAGAMRTAPVVLAEYDLGRSAPGLTAVDEGRSHLAIVAGTLHCYDPAGRERWAARPEGLTLTRVVACEDLDGDGAKEVVLEAGRPAQPYGAVVSVSLADGRVLWKEDVEPMSYSWQAYVASYLPGVEGKQVLVVMQGYPPDQENGYAAMYEFPKGGAAKRVWRYPFSAYTCFPAVFTTDVNGDGVKEIAVISHSRMWVLDAPTGAVKQFIGWDVSPANVRSYGLNQFVDLDGDGREDFVCLANFSKHYEVLLNRGGKFIEAWHQGWADSVTTAHVSVCWPAVAFADLDGDGKKELVVSVYDQGHWTVRAHDAVTGQVKYQTTGVVAAAMADVDGDGRAEVLGDRASAPSRSQPDGGYEIEKTDGAVVLKVVGGKLKEVWSDASAEAVRAAGALTVARQGKQFTLGGGFAPAEKAPPPPPPPAVSVPAVVGAMPQDVFAADVLGEGTNQVVVYAKPTASVLRLEGGALRKVLDVPSDCAPVIADLDGDGGYEVVTASKTEMRALNLRGGAVKTVWRIATPSVAAGVPWPNLLYLRAGRFLGHAGHDLFLSSGEPHVTSAVIDGRDGKVAWTRSECSGLERYFGPTHNLVVAHDVDGDSVDEIIYENPDYYCVVDARAGTFRTGPVSPQTIFAQPSQGLYTAPAYLGGATRAADRVCLSAGHYFQGVLTPDAKPGWFRTPVIGRARSAREGFLRLPDGTWLLGYGRQDGQFECIDVATGKTRWTYDLRAVASDVTACDVDGGGRAEFVFTTSDGRLCALADDGGKPRLLWTAECPAGSGAAVPADVNGDGRAEIVVPCADGRVRVFAAP